MANLAGNRCQSPMQRCGAIKDENGSIPPYKKGGGAERQWSRSAKGVVGLAFGNLRQDTLKARLLSPLW
jgi:hypothetical protein